MTREVPLVDLNVPGIDDLAPQPDEPQLRKRLVAVQRVAEVAEDRGHGVVDGDLVLQEPVSHRGKALGLDVQRIEGRPREQRREDVHAGPDAAEGADVGEPIGAADMEIVGVLHDLVKHVPVVLNDPLGTPGRAGGIEQCGDRVR